MGDEVNKILSKVTSRNGSICVLLKSTLMGCGGLRNCHGEKEIWE